MKIRLVLTAVLALLVVSLTAAGAQNVLDLARIQDQTLDNGMHIILKSEPYWRAVALGLVIRSGAKNDPVDQSGVAHLVEHLLFEPTGSGTSLSLSTEDLGGYVNAETSADFTEITLGVASQFAPDLMQQLAATVFGAKFTSDQVEAEKTIISQEMDDRFASLDTRLESMGFDLAFTQHPYRLPIPGTKESLTKLTAADAQKFYLDHYVPANVALVAVGDLDPTAFFALARQQFGPIPARAAAPENLPVEPPQTEPRTRIVESDIANTVIQYAWRAPGISDPSAVCAMDLIYTAMDRGETSLLTKALDNQHLALHSEANFLTQKYPGLFTITLVTPPDQELPARQALLALVASFRDQQSTDEELTYLKKLLYADYAFENQSYADQVGTLSFYEAISNYRFACNYLLIARAVTAAQLQQVAQKYLAEDKYNLTIIHPPSASTGGGENA
jgi:zinc protease